MDPVRQNGDVGSDWARRYCSPGNARSVWDFQVPREGRYSLDVSFFQANPVGGKKGCETDSLFDPLIPKKFLWNAALGKRLSALQFFACSLDVSGADLKAVYRAGLARHGIEDRLARVRTYLYVVEAAQKSVDNEFLRFADRVITGLRQEWELNIETVSVLTDLWGFEISGLYQEYNDRTLRIAENGGDYLSDWSRYVTLHELRHWYDFRSGFHRNSDFAQMEWRAARVGMEALFAVTGGRPVAWEGKERNVRKTLMAAPELKKVGENIQKLPLPVQPNLSLLWEEIVSFGVRAFEESYIRYVCEASSRAWFGNEATGDLEAEGRGVVARQFVFQKLVQEADRIVREIGEGNFSSNQCLCDPSVPADEALEDDWCRPDLASVFAYALQNQLPLSRHLMGLLIAVKVRDSGG